MILSLRNETPATVAMCAAPDCENPITPAVTGRPARYCSPACRAAAHRHRHNTPPAVAEVTMGSASSRGRNPDNAWIVQLHRGTHNIVIAIGLRRPDADRLAQQINDLLANPCI